MVTSAAVGSHGYFALRDKVMGLQMCLSETCSGGCDSWKETADGRKRFEELKKVNTERKERGLSHVS